MKNFNLIKLGIILLSLSAIFSNYSVYADEASLYNQKYDPTRDPTKDLQLAASKASKESKYVLVMVGGEWCTWCKTLEAHFKNEPKMYSEFTSVFEIMKVNYSKENKNDEFLSPFPKIKGYPHFLIFNDKSELISSIDSSPFKKDKAYINKPFEELARHFAAKVNKNKNTHKENSED